VVGKMQNRVQSKACLEVVGAVCAQHSAHCLVLLTQAGGR
jgi:hypothetical protein